MRTSDAFWAQSPRHMCYNRLPLLADVVYDTSYDGTGVEAQHAYPYRETLTPGDVVFVKTDYLSWFLANRTISVPITLVTGVSDLSPTPEECRHILDTPNITKWIGCNILQSDPKIIKMPIGVGEPGRVNGDHDSLVRLHAERVPWIKKDDSLCVPYHGETHGSRVVAPTLPRLDFQSYMRALSAHKFVLCQRGNGVDTHRVCETLLMGSVPVIEHSGLDDMYSQWPCLLVDSVESVDTTSFVWDDAKYEAFLDVFWLREVRALSMNSP